MTKALLSQQIDAVQFAMWELHLYLDTHPDDISALALFKKYGVSWLKNPWPWDLGGNN